MKEIKKPSKENLKRLQLISSYKDKITPEQTMILQLLSGLIEYHEVTGEFPDFYNMLEEFKEK